MLEIQDSGWPDVTIVNIISYTSEFPTVRSENVCFGQQKQVVKTNMLLPFKLIWQTQRPSGRCIVKPLLIKDLPDAEPKSKIHSPICFGIHLHLNEISGY